MGFNNYAHEKLIQTLTAILHMDVPLRERFIAGVLDGIIHITPERDLSDDDRGKFEHLLNRLTRYPSNEEQGTIAATAYRVDETELHGFIDEIVDLYVAAKCEARDKGVVI